MLVVYVYAGVIALAMLLSLVLSQRDQYADSKRMSKGKAASQRILHALPAGLVVTTISLR